MSSLLSRLILGRALANRESGGRKIGVFEGVPEMGLDALASSSYGPEAALAILIPLGAAGTGYLRPIMAVILALLVILYLSYRQIVRAYPQSGGAYVVSRENLGVNASLLAAAALMVDYVLNVAVGISAGVGALTSAVPSLHAYTLWLCLAVLALVTLANLRGLQDAGRVFAVPTYLFAASFVVVLAVGVAKALASGGHPQPVVAPPRLHDAAAAAGLWILIRAFAAGCTAMTGVEAVSNGVDAFRPPVVKRAHRTLGAIVGILVLLLTGIAYLAPAYGVGAMDQSQEGYRSVPAQLAAAVVGEGAFYYVALGSLLCVLALSANSSFAGFPRLCRLVAQDGFLPRPFAMVGRRLVFSVGIWYLAATAGALLVIFGGITDRLIPLFAVGAFLTFTLSQSGMVAHGLRAGRAGRGHRGGHRLQLAVNAVGAVATGVATLVIVAAKFTEGAWITVLVIPGFILLLKSIKRYDDRLALQLREDGPVDLERGPPPIVFIATEGWNRLTDRALHLAMNWSPDVYAVHLTALGGPQSDDDKEALRRQWAKDVDRPAKEAGFRPPKLVFLQAPFRRAHAPLLKLIEQTRAEHPNRQIAVVIPEVVKQRWWQYLLHNHRAARLRHALLCYGSDDLIVLNIPWHLETPRMDEALDEEEQKTALRRS